MYIMSQDKKTICSCTKLSAGKNFGGGKTQKYVITGETANNGGIVLGFYEEEKLAMVELQNVFAAIEEGCKIYAIK